MFAFSIQFLLLSYHAPRLGTACTVSLLRWLALATEGTSSYKDPIVSYTYIRCERDVRLATHHECHFGAVVICSFVFLYG